MQALIIYFAAINILGFLMMAVDKKKAVRSKRRIRERTFFIIAWLGGSPGVFLGIFAFRHKTRHKKFTVGLPFIMAAQITAAILVFELSNRS